MGEAIRLIEGSITTPRGFRAAGVFCDIKQLGTGKEVTDSSNRTQAPPTQDTWYNLGSVSISIPIGTWRVSYHVAPEAYDTASGNWTAFVTLSTANNSESDTGFTNLICVGALTGLTIVSVYREKCLSVTSKTSYYLNTKTNQVNQDSIQNRGDLSKTIIRSVCAYL